MDNKNLDQKFMLLCGFEKFNNYFVRIDILERLFVQIINSNNNEDNKEIKMVPEMLNLLGCGKSNFKKLLKSMNYKITERKDDTYFKYIPKKVTKKNFLKNRQKESPFNILKRLQLN